MEKKNGIMENWNDGMLEGKNRIMEYWNLGIWGNFWGWGKRVTGHGFPVTDQ
jgi:hypothetical protein